ncbi:pitrilysin family protein [Limnohabitans sp. 15K]|uniref:M16 family metallopeptidase n=1 Tax=Limnohabitans sp. 15K TaxID=1100706 RepID=UPI000C1F39B8|nr:pitrilysin family protein [Limnohabitans sp. 15K]PIT82908.1 peptidase M16 [Limnohabitans sp. 15K]
MKVPHPMFLISSLSMTAGALRRSALLLACWGAVGWAHASLPIQHWTQPSGARVYLVESHAIPMVDVQIDIDAGSRRDPAAQAGLASVMTGQMANGTRAEPQGQGPYPKAMDENQIGEAWADLGASFGASAGSDRMSFGLRSLSYPDLLSKAAALAARQMAHPAFPEAMWLRDRERINASIRESLTKPGTVVQHRFAEAVYGVHPYGYRVTPESLSRIAAQDLKNLHAQALRACRATVSVVGALTRAQADDLVQRLLAQWPRESGCPSLPPVPEVAPLAAAQTLNLPFDSAQAHVLIGQPGYKRTDPDFFALLVGNHILGGGGFVSRLTEQVREKRGLSYSVYSAFAPGLHAGAFTVGLQTRPDQATQAVAVAQEVVQDFVRQGPTEAELQAAKSNLVGGFALRIDSNRKLLDNVANIAWNRLPLDYLSHWTRQIERVSAADVQRAMGRVLQPERMVTVVVGASAP